MFQANLLQTFLEVLLNSLVNQSHDLLKEDIGLTIHTMASVDLRTFNSDFMGHYLLQAHGLTDHQKGDMLKAFQNQEVGLFILLVQWFLTLLEVLMLTSSIYAFMEPFVVGKIKLVFFLRIQIICI